MKRPERFLAMLCAAGLFSACAGAKASRGGAGAGAPGGSPAPVEAGRRVETEPDARGLNARAVPELNTIRFAYDNDALDADARLVLKANAAYLKTHRDVDIQVAGHCDERGTEAYNLALGQRRARTVRDFYLLLGVDGARVATISYGREKPACRESDEACWSVNRRAETLVLTGGDLAGGPRAAMSRP